MKKTTLHTCISFILLMILIVSCKTVGRFETTKIHLGMTPQEVTNKFGQPYKMQMTTSLSNQKMVQSVFYIYREKEAKLTDHSDYYYVLLFFENERLVKVEQTPDEPKLLNFFSVLN